jgi:hypothetical protein
VERSAAFSFVRVFRGYPRNHCHQTEAGQTEKLPTALSRPFCSKHQLHVVLRLLETAFALFPRDATIVVEVRTSDEL